MLHYVQIAIKEGKRKEKFYGEVVKMTFLMKLTL